MLSADELGRNLHETLSAQKLGVLATSGSGQPHASLVGFVASADLRSLTFATPRATRKFTNLQSTRRVAFLVDNRSHSTSDFQQAVAVTAYGPAEELHGAEREAARERYLEKHPFLRDFTGAPSCAIVQIQVERYSLVTRFQEVAELEVAPWTWSTP
jgi:hypothetical protein